MKNKNGYTKNKEERSTTEQICERNKSKVKHSNCFSRTISFIFTFKMVIILSTKFACLSANGQCAYKHTNYPIFISISISISDILHFLFSFSSLSTSTSSSHFTLYCIALHFIACHISINYYNISFFVMFLSSVHSHKFVCISHCGCCGCIHYSQYP